MRAAFLQPQLQRVHADLLARTCRARSRPRRRRSASPARDRPPTSAGCTRRRSRPRAAFGMSYGAKAHRQPFITGEPGKAPAWNLKMPSAATILPSFVTPILTHIDEPEVGPVALNTSSRLIMQPDRQAGLLRQQRGDRLQVDDGLAAEAAADLGRDRRADRRSACRRICAVSARIWKWPWLDDQISPWPSASQRATQACGSI